jgi:methyltransferase-like protein
LVYNWNAMTGLKSVLSHSTTVVTRKTGNEYVLVPISNNIADMDKVFTLNETGAFIWEQIDGKRSVEEIINSLTEEYDIEKVTASEDVFTFIDNMNKYLIINNANLII